MSNTQTNGQVNGIDTTALKGAMAAISQDPKQGVAKFAVCTRWTGGTRAETKVAHWELGGKRLERGFTVYSDEPHELCGTASAPNPQEILMAGLNSCIMVGYVAGCAMKGIELEAIEIATEGELDLRGFLGLAEGVKPGYDELRYTVRLRGNGTPEQFQEVHQTVMATSPNFFNLSRPIPLRPTLVLD